MIIKCTTVTQLKKIIKEEGWKGDLDLDNVYNIISNSYGAVCIDQTGCIGYEELFRKSGAEIIEFTNSKYNKRKK